jgi:hypothetical protein
LKRNNNSSQELQESYFKEMIAKNENLGICIKSMPIMELLETNTKNRTAFNQMIEDAKKENSKIIITKSISRFARNTLIFDICAYAKRLNKACWYFVRS